MIFLNDNSYFLSYSMFRTLREALQNRDDSDIVVAEDISSTGQKHFIVGKTEKLNVVYSKLSHRHWYECLVENKASRLFLDIESTQTVNIHKIVKFFYNVVRVMYNIDGTFEVIDSCNQEKYSWHVICTNLYFRNIYHVGAFVRRAVLAMDMSSDDSAKDCIHAIDTAVYTKNRMFRVNGSTKYGSSRQLKHRLPWSSLLVQSPPANEIQDCLEIDSSTPVSTSASPFSLFRYEQCTNTWHAREKMQRRANTKVDTYCPLLGPILDWLDSTLDTKIQRHKLSMTSHGIYIVPTNSTNCAIAKRCHRGNNIWLSINIHRKIVNQKCHDEECVYKCSPISVPNELWNLWDTTWHQKVVELKE